MNAVGQAALKTRKILRIGFGTILHGQKIWRFCILRIFGIEEKTMTRRTIVFIDKLGRVWTSPEFNGDRSEYSMRNDTVYSCDKRWEEIMARFKAVKSLKEFRRQVIKAQGYYHSFFGDSKPLPVIQIQGFNLVKGFKLMGKNLYIKEI